MRKKPHYFSEYIVNIQHLHDVLQHIFSYGGWEVESFWLKPHY